MPSVTVLSRLTWTLISSKHSPSSPFTPTPLTEFFHKRFAYLEGIRDYMLNKKEYVLKQVGNPDGDDKPNKKYFDPRVWVREGEKTMAVRVKQGLSDFNTSNQL